MSSTTAQQRSGAARRLAPILLPVAGVVLGLVVAEIGFRFAELRPLRLEAADANWRMHYIDTEGGIGKCYPSDVRQYFAFDLRTDEGMRRLGSIIGAVSDLPDEMDLEARIAHLRQHAPLCNNVALRRLNAGPEPESPRKALIIGDSFAFGEGLRLEDTIGYRLAEHYPGINFPNMSWPGTSVKTVYDVGAVGPDIDTVLYFYNLNDLLRSEDLQQQRLRLHEVSRQARLLPDLPDDGWFAAFCRPLRLCQAVLRRASERSQSQATVDYYHEIYFGDENREPRRASFDLIGAMSETLASQGVRFVVVVFPLYYRPPLSDYPLRRIHERVARELEDLGVEFVDLLPAYERHRFWDKFMVHPLDRHPSAEAIEVAARHLRDVLDLDAHLTARSRPPGNPGERAPDASAHGG